MATNRIIDVDSKPTIDFSQQLFEPLPHDARLVKKQYVPFSPFNGLSENLQTIRFVLPALEGPYSYDLTDMQLGLKLSICQENGEVIPPDANVSVCNLPIFAAFKALKIYFNKKNVSFLFFPASFNAGKCSWHRF